MTPDIAIVLAILTGAVLLFVTGWVRMDIVALMVMASLALTGTLSVEEALSGFSSPAVVTVWAVLILSAGLARTGVAGWIGRRLLRLAGDRDVRLLVIIMLTAGLLSGFMNSIGVAALFLPVVIDIARRTHRPPSKLLMPLAFAALMGGLTTLIGTPPNLLISQSLAYAGLAPFRMFDFAPVGITVLLVGTIYMALIGRRLLPARDIAREFSYPEPAEFEAIYDLHERMVFVRLPHDSALDGKTLAETRLGSVLGINVVAIVRQGRTQLAPDANVVLRSGDRLLVEGKLEDLRELQSGDHLVLQEERLSVERLVSTEVDLVEVRLRPGSPLVGASLRQAGFRHAYHVIVLAIRREGLVLRTNLERMPLLADDVLLVQGKREHLEALKEEADLTVAPPDSIEAYNLEERLMMVRVPSGSGLAGKTLIESRLGDAFGLGVLGIVRRGTSHLMPTPEERLEADDLLLVKGRLSDMLMIQGLQTLEVESDAPPALGDLETEETGLAEAVLSPHTTLAGRTLREIDFRARFGLSVLAIWREGRAYRSRLREMQLRFGDALLLYGPRQRVRMLGMEQDFLVLTEGAQEPPRSNRALPAVLIMAAVLLPVILGWLSIAIAAVVGVVLMVLSGCLTPKEAYRSIQWEAVFLIAGMLPLGIALEKTGAASFLAQGVVGGVGGLGATAVMGGIFLLAALASQVMPNPAVAVLLAPIALNAAADLGVSPYPMMMTVAVSASAAFLSPVGHSANLLVMGPGGYRFSDYVRVGLPLTLLVMAAVLLMMPVFWPF